MHFKQDKSGDDCAPPPPHVTLFKDLFHFHLYILCLADVIHNFNWVTFFRFDKMEVNCFKILLIYVTIYLYLNV